MRCKALILTAGIGIALAGCSTLPSNGVAPVVHRPEPHSFKTLVRQYPAPEYVSAWSCISQQDAMRDLVEQLSVTVSSETVASSERHDLDVHYDTSSDISADSIEQLHGLILRRDKGCVFVAINKKDAKDSFTDLARMRETQIYTLLTQLKNGRTALDRLSAAKKLRDDLHDIRRFHNVIAAMGGHPRRVKMSALQELRMRRALSFNVSGEYASSGSSETNLMHYMYNQDETDMVSNFMQKAGYIVPADPNASQTAFTLTVRTREILDESQHCVTNNVAYNTPFYFTVAVQLTDAKTGDTLYSNSTQYSMCVDVWFKNHVELNPNVIDGLLNDMLAHIDSDTSSAGGSY